MEWFCCYNVKIRMLSKCYGSKCYYRWDIYYTGLNQTIDIWPESLFPQKSGFTRIYSVQIWCAQTRGKSKAKRVNTAFACQFAWGCKFEGKCGIYHLCPLFNLSLHFFAPNLHWVNLVWIKFFVQCLGLSCQNLIYRTLAIKEKRPNRLHSSKTVHLIISFFSVL